jgi:hypothetical protein
MWPRIGARLSEFKLPTLRPELVVRFKQVGLGHAHPLLLEVLELEAGDRRQRRIQRLFHAQSQRQESPSRRSSTPACLTQKLRDLSSADFLERADNVLAFGLPGQLPPLPTGQSHFSSLTEKRRGLNRFLQRAAALAALVDYGNMKRRDLVQLAPALPRSP